MPLTADQLRHLRTLDWLVGGARRSGRTHVMAVAIIREASRRPGTYVAIWDHVSHDVARSNLRSEIEDLTSADPRLASAVSFRSTSQVRIDLERPILDWMPVGTAPEEPSEPEPESPPAPTALDQLLADD